MCPVIGLSAYCLNFRWLPDLVCYVYRGSTKSSKPCDDKSFVDQSSVYCVESTEPGGNVQPSNNPNILYRNYWAPLHFLGEYYPSHIHSMIRVHMRANSDSYSWINYCDIEKTNIPKLINIRNPRITSSCVSRTTMRSSFVDKYCSMLQHGGLINYIRPFVCLFRIMWYPNFRVMSCYIRKQRLSNLIHWSRFVIITDRQGTAPR